MKTMQMWAAGGVAVVLALAGPVSQASAQAVSGDSVDTVAVVGNHGNWTLNEREKWLQDRLQTARDDGSINGDEFDRVHHEIDRIRDDENHMRGDHDGSQLTDNETATLETRLDGVADQIHWLHEDQFRRPW
jgi:hypothetical protein